MVIHACYYLEGTNIWRQKVGVDQIVYNVVNCIMLAALLWHLLTERVAVLFAIWRQA